MMTLVAIILGLGLFALVVGVAFWFATEEQKTIKPEPELDDHTRQARRESAGSIARVAMPDFLCGFSRMSEPTRRAAHGKSEEDQAPTIRFGGNQPDRSN